MSALEQNGKYELSDNGLEVSARANDEGTYIHIKYEKSEAKDFRKFIENLDDEIFVEVCDTLGDEKIKTLQEKLDKNIAANEIAEFKTIAEKLLVTKITTLNKQLGYVRANM